MNIVYVSNDAFAQHLAVALHSLYTWEKAADVTVISTGISPENAGRLESIAEAAQQKLHIVQFDTLEQEIRNSRDLKLFDVSVFGRFFLARLLPETMERVLYLDADTVVNGPLQELWDTDLSGAVLGAVPEPTVYPETKASIGLDASEPYFNSGVLLIDLKKWRQENLETKLVRYETEHLHELRFYDQDVINAVLRGRIRTLRPRYNFFSNYAYFSYDTLTRMDASYAEAVSREEYEAAAKEPAIVHFAGGDRPWKAGCRNPFRVIYEKHLQGTPWAGTPGQEGERLYLLAYRGLNLATRYCPPVRILVNRRYGRKLYR